MDEKAADATQEGKAGAPESLATRRGYSLNVDDACIINRKPSAMDDDCAAARLGPSGITVRRLTSMCERIAAGGHAESIEAVKQYQQNEVMAVITDVRLALPDCITWNTRNLPMIRCTVFYDLPRMR